MNTKEFIGKVEKSIDLNLGTIDLNDNFDKCGYWDSMSYIIFLALVEQELGLKLPAKDVEDCETISELIKLCKSKLDD
jgi:acyl carrier protein